MEGVGSFQAKSFVGPAEGGSARSPLSLHDELGGASEPLEGARGCVVVGSPAAPVLARYRERRL